MMVKASTVYRQIRPELRSVRPAEIWWDSQVRRRFVTFGAGSEEVERIFLFTLVLGLHGQSLIAAHRVEARSEGWMSEALPVLEPLSRGPRAPPTVGGAPSILTTSSGHHPRRIR